MSKPDFSNLESLDGIEMDSGEWKDEKPIHKSVRYLRKKPFVKELHKNHRSGYITDLSGNHKVRLDWKLNEVAQRDKIFKLTIDEKVVYLDLEELTFYTRVMFEK